MDRRFLLCLLFILFIPILLIGYPSRKTLTGAEAANLIPGASKVTYDTDGSTIQYVELLQNSGISTSTAPGYVLDALGLDHRYTLNFKNQSSSIEGQEHHRYVLAFEGAEVQDGMLILHFLNGNLRSFNGGIHQRVRISNENLLGSGTSRELALAAVGAESYRWEDPSEEAHLKRETGNNEATYFPEGQLVLLPMEDDENFTHRYAWKFDVYSLDPVDRHEVYIDAATGAVIMNLHLLCHADVQGIAVTDYSGTRTITADSTGTTYRLRETGRGNGIETYNMQTGTSYASAVDFTDSDNYWDNVNSQMDEVATDAHWGAEMTYDYYWNIHNRNSIDGNGFALISYVHYDYAYANAFWDGYRMTYGDGSGSIGPLVALDIVAHEISHGLTSYTASLVYSYESGALNEAFSDIFGTAVEHFAKPNSANWTIGEDIGSAFRSMSNPNAYGDPDTYLGNNWYTGSGDNGGVHTNSGVLNHWFYLLSEGGSGVNDNGDSYSLSGIGVLNAGKIAFRMLSVYLTPNDQYYDARFYGIKSAVDLFGACSPEVESVTNAFYAIGVGPAYVNGVVADFNAMDTSFCSVPAEVRFNNSTVNGLNFSWDFGDGNSSADVEPLHYYNTAGTYDVMLIVDGGACGADTIVKQAFIDVNPPARPQALHGESCGPGSMTLVASAQDSVVWYAPGGVYLASGDTFTTPLLSQTTEYYAYNIQASPPSYGGKPDNSGGGGYFSSSNSHHLVFDCSSPTVLKSVKVYAASPGNRTIELRNSSGTVLVAKNVNIPSGQSRVTLDFNIPVGTDFQLAGPGSPYLYRNSSGCNYPYSAGPNIQITGSSAWTDPYGYYYYFYDWEVEEQPCVSEYSSVWAYVNTDAPQADFSYSQYLDSVLFQNQSNEGNSFFWDFGDGNTSVKENPSHLYASSGTYNVVLTVFNACGVDSIIQQVPVIITNTNQMNKGEVSIFPNPAGSFIRLSGVNTLGSDVDLKVYAVDGALIYSRRVKGEDMLDIDVVRWPEGMYFMQLRSGDAMVQRKLIIAR